MASIRRALIFASAGRYASRAVNLATTIVIARLMDPKEFGISVLGASSFLILGAIRELASVNYMVQQKELTRDKINSVFTVSFVITVLMTATVLLLAHPIAELYGEPRLATYIQIATIGFAVGPFMQPIYALWSRDLAFRTISAMDVMAAVVSAVTSIGLVWLGFSYIGLAWSSTISAVLGVAVALWVSRKQLAIFRFSLKEWKSVLSYGFYGSATAMIYRVSDALGFLVLGKLLNAYAIGLLQRAVTLATFTDTVILAGVNSITLPAFSHKARSGADLKESYLTAVSYVTAVQWPALAFISAMAAPLTFLVLGPRWMEIAPLAQIIALSLMFNFAGSLNFPLLVAVGAIRKTWMTASIQVVISLVVVVLAASHGLLAIALSGLLTVPLSLALWTSLVRKHVHFSFYELLTAMRKSFLVLLCSAAGPIAVLVYRNGAPSTVDAAVAAILCGGGWLLGIWLTRHAFLNEMTKVRNVLLRRRPQGTGV